MYYIEYIISMKYDISLKKTIIKNTSLKCESLVKSTNKSNNIQNNINARTIH